MLENMPEVSVEAQPFWDAYCALSDQRTSGAEGPNPISFSDIHAFVKLSKIVDPDEIDDLVRIVRRLDMMYLADYAQRRDAARKRRK